MTTPCPHSDSGWCLDCVAILLKDKERLDFLATCDDGWPPFEYLGPDVDSYDIYCALADNRPEPEDCSQCDTKATPEEMRAGLRLIIDREMARILAP